MKHAAVTLGSGNLRQAVVLPDGEDLNEWVAVNSQYNPGGAIGSGHPPLLTAKPSTAAKGPPA